MSKCAKCVALEVCLMASAHANDASMEVINATNELIRTLIALPTIPEIQRQPLIDNLNEKAKIKLENLKNKQETLQHFLNFKYN